MKILSVECSASPVSVCISENGKILSSGYSNIKVTHSETLMPIINNCLASARINLSDIDSFAVANGPGSFTGIRIGISAVKGLAAADNKPCVGVSTLLAMASRFSFEDAVISPVMDARCNQFYNALFRVKNGTVTRLTEDRAVLTDELTKELSGIKEKIIICGDGARVFAPCLKEIENAVFAGGELEYQNAVGVSIAAEKLINEEKAISPADLLPVYLRLPQAERELKSKKKD